MTKTQLAWVAGLLEGEGSFTLKSKTSGTKRNIVAQCHMTDYDVLLRLHRLTGIGHLRGPYANGTGKPRYNWAVSGPPAYLLMKDLLPLMCQRRRARITELIAGYDSVVTKTYRIQHLATGRIETVTSLSEWCHAHNMGLSALWRTLEGTRTSNKGWRRLS